MFKAKFFITSFNWVALSLVWIKCFVKYHGELRRIRKVLFSSVWNFYIRVSCHKAPDSIAVWALELCCKAGFYYMRHTFMVIEVGQIPSSAEEFSISKVNRFCKDESAIQVNTQILYFPLKVNLSPTHINTRRDSIITKKYPYCFRGPQPDPPTFKTAIKSFNMPLKVFAHVLYNLMFIWNCNVVSEWSVCNLWDVVNK